MIVSRTFTFNVTAPSAGPDWFKNLPANTWVPLGNTIDSVVEPAAPYAESKTTDFITGAGNGAGVDQVNKEMLIVNTGGHSGWWGGDGYRLILTENAAPRWERLVTWLPSYRSDVAYITSSSSAPNPSIPLALEEFTMLQYVDYGGGVTLNAQGQGSTDWRDPDGLPWDRLMWPCTFCDGVSVGERVEEWKPWTVDHPNDIMERPRAVHTAYAIHYSEGQMWYPTQFGSNNGSGRGSRVPHSFDADFVRSYKASTGNPYPYGYGDKVPWTYYDAVDSGTLVSTFGSSALDTGSGRIWTQSANSQAFFWLGTKGAEKGQHTLFQLPFSANSRFTCAPSAICPDSGRRMWVTVCTTGVAPPTGPAVDEIVVYDLAQLETGVSPSTAVTKVTVIGLGALPWARLRAADEARKGYGMIWHEPSLAFLLFNCDESPRTATTTTLFKLIPPLYADGTWNKSGAWTVDTVEVQGVPAICSSSPPGISGSSFSRFNIINDMGNGESLLISQGDRLSPASFMRLANAPLVEAPPGTVLFQETHDTMPIGTRAAESNEGVWKTKINGASPNAIVEIAQTTPLVSSTRYMKSTLIKNGTTNYRTERQMDTGYFPNMTSLGNGHYRASQDYWYGFRLRIDRVDDNIHGYYIQWHDNPGGDGLSPPIALDGSNTGLWLRLEKNADNGGNNYTSANIISPPFVGVAHDFMFRIRWDTRSNAQGGSGECDVYVDENTTPSIQWRGQTCHPGPGSTDGRLPYIKWGLYKSLYGFAQGTTGATNIQTHDHLTIMGADGSRLGVKPPLPRV